MHRYLAALALTTIVALPSAARAGWIIEGSYGKGAKVKPSPTEATQSNIMIAPGFTVPFLRFELGFLNELPDTKNSKYDIELRPMIVVAPPIFPLYGRAIFAVTNILNGKTTMAYGGAAGVKLGLGPVGVFAEAGLLPRSVASTIYWVVEGRLGVTLEF